MSVDQGELLPLLPGLQEGVCTLIETTAASKCNLPVLGFPFLAPHICKNEEGIHFTFLHRESQ